MWNHYAHYETYFGAIVAGGVLHTLNLRLAAEEIGYIARHAHDRFLIVDDILLPLFEQFRKEVDLERVIVVPLTGKPVPDAYEDYEKFLQTATGHFSYPEMDENEPCAMCYTSGTTGRPKGVVYSHRSQILHSLVQAMPDGIGMCGKDVILPVVPMFHANAWGIPYTAVMLGAKMVFPGPHLHPEDLLPLLESEQVTLSCGVPTIWLPMVQMIAAHPDRWKLSPKLRLTVGGSAVPEAMIRAYAAIGIEVLQGWGMTETSPLATISKVTAQQAGLSDDQRFATLAKQGYPLPLVDVRIVGDDDVQAPWDGRTTGEVQVHGPWITGSYHDQPAPENFTRDGWLRTGDVASIDALGYLKISDRTKDLIKSGGEWISSVDLENAIMGHPAVQEAAVIAVPHPKWSERPLAVIVLRPGATADAPDIRAHLSKQFVKWMVPDAYVFVNAIPRTSTGKFLKTKLREQYRDWQWTEN
jgi:fatty-acyl-CoA synthase